MWIIMTAFSQLCDSECVSPNGPNFLQHVMLTESSKYTLHLLSSQI